MSGRRAERLWHPANSAVTLAICGRQDSGWSEGVRRSLLICGALAGLSYIIWHEVAALQWEGYSRIANSISEMHLTGAPSRSVLEPWQGIVYNALLLGFGVGVWQSARGRRALRVVGGLFVLGAAAAPLWFLFGEASLGAHIALSVLSISIWFGTMGFAATAFGGPFRAYSFLTLTVIVFFGLAFTYTDEVAAGLPTAWMGLFERVAYGAYLVWIGVLAGRLWRTGNDSGRAEEPIARAPIAAKV